MRKRIDIPIWYQKNRIVELRKKYGFNQQDVADKIDCVLKTYQNYEQGHNYPTLEYAAKLAELYGVSIDYLLGRSDCISVENDKIKDIIGLDDTAINTLVSWYSYQKDMKKEYQEQTYFPIEVLNILLANRFETEFLLNSIQDLLKSDYKIPAYHNGKFVEANINEKYNKCLTPQYVVSDSPHDMIKGVYGSNDTYLLTLVKDKTKTWDNVQIALNDDFFESIALKSIEKHLLEIKNDFQNKESDD